MDPSNYYSPIPGQPPTYQKKILSALMGDDPNTLPLDPNALPPGSDMPGQTIPTTGVGNGQTTTSTTQPAKSEVPDPNAASSSSGALTQNQGENNSDFFTRLLNSGQYKTPQDAINYFNSLGLGKDSSGTSSNYGSSPAYYDNGLGQIGLPDRYLVKNADGTWTTTMRGSSGDVNKSQGGSGGFGVNPLSYLSGGQNAQDPMDTIMSRILAALNQYGGG